MNATLNRTSATRILAAMAIALTAAGDRLAAQPRLQPAETSDAYEQELPPPADPYPGEDEALSTMRPEAPAYLGISLDGQVRNAAIVQSVTPGGAADHAGLKAGDRIEALNGNRVDSYHDVLEIVDSLRAGDIIDIDFSRRISGTTQAVLDARRQEGPTTAYRQRDARTRDRVDQASYEDLPNPSYADGRDLQPMPRRIAEPRDDEFSEEGADRRDEPEPRGRLFDRGNRGRGLLPWRKN